MPKSKAKTAYGLLSEIRSIILANPERYDQREVRQESQCGSICCVGGWVTLLKAPRTRQGNRLDRAEQILGINDAVGNELWFAGAAGSRTDAVAHARRGAAHIAAFQKKYAKQLKAKKV